MNKYIVKNCPAIVRVDFCDDGEILDAPYACCRKRKITHDCKDCSDCVIKKLNTKLQEIYDSAGTGATTYVERLVKECRELLGINGVTENE